MPLAAVSPFPDSCRKLVEVVAERGAGEALVERLLRFERGPASAACPAGPRSASTAFALLELESPGEVERGYRCVRRGCPSSPAGVGLLRVFYGTVMSTAIAGQVRCPADRSVGLRLASVDRALQECRQSGQHPQLLQPQSRRRERDLSYSKCGHWHYLPTTILQFDAHQKLAILE